MKSIVKISSLMVLLAGAAVAQPWGDGPKMMAMGDGVLLSLSGSAHKTVVQDRVQATLSFEQDGKTAQDVQNAINTKMQAAQKIYAKYADVKVKTGGYNVWQQYAAETVVENGKVVKNDEKRMWHGSQQLILDADAKSNVLKLAGELQQAGFAMQGMYYTLSAEASEKLTDDLTTEALEKIRARAKKIGATLEMSKVEFVSVNTDGGYAPQPMPMMMAKAAGGAERDMAAPVGQAGESEVNVNVQAMVKLKK